VKNSVIVVQVEAWFEAEEGSTRQKPASAIFQEVLHSIGVLRWGKRDQLIRVRVMGFLRSTNPTV